VPNTVHKAMQVTYRRNWAGMRAEREYPPKPPPGVRRLAAFGDSFTHCVEVDVEDCWTAHLEQAWARTDVRQVATVCPPGGCREAAVPEPSRRRGGAGERPDAPAIARGGTP
jgi:hypothetical protein